MLPNARVTATVTVARVTELQGEITPLPPPTLGLTIFAKAP